jgi:hypothetical protein
MGLMMWVYVLLMMRVNHAVRVRTGRMVMPHMMMPTINCVSTKMTIFNVM